MKHASILNITSLVLFVSLFLFTPFDGFKRIVILGALLVIWFVTSFVVNGKAMRKTLPLFLQLLCLMLLQWVYSSFTGEEDQFRRFFTQNLWTYIWGIIGVFYAYNISVFKRCIPFVVVMISVSCIYTIIGNIAIPGASRMLAGSAIEGSQTYSLIHSMNVGGYGFIYALMFAVVPCTLWIMHRLNMLLIPLLFLILIISTLLVGSYFISIILAIVAIASTLTNTKSVSKFILVSFVLILLVVALSDLILQGLVDFGAWIDSPMLQTRAQQMIDGTYQDAYDSSGDYSRLDRMKNALYNIGQSPLFGRMTGRHLDIRPSGHSELLGYFERFGIFGMMHIFYFYSIFRIINRCTVTKDMRIRISIFSFLFFLFITLDTFDIANSTGCMVFFLAPCAMLYIEFIVNRSGINDNKSSSLA